MDRGSLSHKVFLKQVVPRQYFCCFLSGQLKSGLFHSCEHLSRARSLDNYKLKYVVMSKIRIHLTTSHLRKKCGIKIPQQDYLVLHQHPTMRIFHFTLTCKRRMVGVSTAFLSMGLRNEIQE